MESLQPRLSLPEKLRAELADAGIARRGYSAELTTADVPARVIELGVIEDIKKFGSDLKSCRLGKAGALGKSEVCVDKRRAVEKLTTGIAELAQRTGRKCVCSKVASRVVCRIGV